MATFNSSEILKTLTANLPTITADTDLDVWQRTATTAASTVVTFDESGAVQYGLHEAYWLHVIQAKVMEGEDPAIQALLTSHVTANAGVADELTMRKVLDAIQPATKTQTSDPATSLALALSDLSWSPADTDVTEGDVLRTTYTAFLSAWTTHMHALSANAAPFVAAAMFSGLFLPILPTFPRAKALAALESARGGNTYGVSITKITAAIHAAAEDMPRETRSTLTQENPAQVAALSTPAQEDTACFHCIAWHGAGTHRANLVDHPAGTCSHLHRISAQHINDVKARRRKNNKNRNRSRNKAQTQNRNRDGNRTRSSSESDNGGEGTSSRSFRS